MKRYNLLLVVGFVFFIACKDSSDKPDQKVKNIILMIGDGMGTAQIYAAYTANKGRLNIEKATYVGFSKTSSSNRYITDSGAGGTAISTGQKTYNQAIAVNSDSIKLKTILESAKEMGLSTGIVVTCQITHATPASFVAHQKSRRFYEAIAEDYVYSGLDLFIGGGQRYFSGRNDSVNYIDSLKYYGYSVVNDIDSISATSPAKTACFSGWDDIPKISEGRGNYLPKATKTALEKLQLNSTGFFVMIEGSHIDWGGHNNDIQYVVEETIDFDNAVGEAFKFADVHPGTLVVVTADHETGGLALIGGNIETGELQARFASEHHTAVMVPVFAYGTGAEEFAGIYENTEIYHKMMKLLGFNE